MKAWPAVLVCMVLAACTSAPEPQRTVLMFNDALFAAPSERVDAADVFALTPAMRQYLTVEIAGTLRAKGRQLGLVEALYKRGGLKLEYDAATTRNAAQAFDARSGNCLSLVIMTAAFAKEMGLPVRYQNVFVEETWGRSGNMYLSIGHVNLSLGRKAVDVRAGRKESDATLIDFLPPEDVRGLYTWTIGEQTIVAMYMNNRAVESLAAGRVDDAYWWAREAIVQDPRFLGAYNTLGVVYQAHGDLREATEVWSYALEQEPGNTRVLSNLAAMHDRQGRVAEARELTRRLEQLEPIPPFSFFKRGMAAMEAGDFKAARDLFGKEVERAAYYHEFHFWLAVAHARLGELDQARKHMAIAMENSTTRKDYDLYAAKLDRIRSIQSH